MTGEILLVLRFGLAIFLYLFLGWALFTLWRDLKHQKEIAAAYQIPPIGVEVQIGNESWTHQFSRHEISIGRDPACECPLNSETVSANHTRLSYHHNQWWVEDMDSTNGTLLNGELITEATVITHGDQIRCGEAILKLKLVG